MPNFREKRILIDSFADGILNDEECAPLYNINASKNLELPY